MDGKVAVITGAASGLGLELSRLCLQRNMCVVMADKNVFELSRQRHLLNSLSGSPVIGVVCDVSNPDSVKHLVQETLDHFGKIDWLINNAGIAGTIAPFWEQKTRTIEQVIQINLLGTLHCIQAFLPQMFKQTWRSHIINIGSVYSLCTSSCMAIYSMSKHALLAFSESLYFDLKNRNKPIDVSIVCPSFMNTSLLENSMQNQKTALQEVLCDLIQRSRSAEDIARAIIYGIEQKLFYILPDQEVKQYGEQRVHAILEQQMPYRHALEKLVENLDRRQVLEAV